MPEDILVSEIMTKNVAVIDAEATIQKASMLLRKRNIHGLVVVKGKEVIGMLTDKDIISKVVAENKSPLKVKVKEVMSPKIIVAKPTDSIDEATRVMFANNVARLPVVDDKNNLVGIITVRDMLRVYPGVNEILTEELEIAEPASVPERTRIEGRCEECDNIAEDLVEIDGRWLCNDCSEDYTG
ncbi:MAG: CBS domain-containing protein [archaeon]